MKITRRFLRRIIKEELENILSAESPEDVEPVEDAWAGGEDLVLPLDHVIAVPGEPASPGLEILDITGE
tara:strand:- start:388 stop:594 length:207 start_codon:yes stop_codon:yes gene_type:complete